MLAWQGRWWHTFTGFFVYTFQPRTPAGHEQGTPCAAQAPQHSGCLPSAPGATVSGSLISVMSGAMEGNLENQVVGDPETVAGATAFYRSSSSHQRSVRVRNDSRSKSISITHAYS